jgi:hypothetical protein
VPFSNYRRDLREHGPDCTSIAYIVGAFTHKTDPNGDPRAPGILNKFRVTCADVCQTAVDPLDTYSSCVDSITNRVITSVAPRLKAHQTTIDISSAQYHGRPLPLVPKTSTSPATGRHLYTVVPSWLSLFGDYRTHAPDGSRNLLFIGGNMPGRRDGGRIWQARFDAFLRGYVPPNSPSLFFCMRNSSSAAAIRWARCARANLSSISDAMDEPVR